MIICRSVFEEYNLLIKVRLKTTVILICVLLLKLITISNLYSCHFIPKWWCNNLLLLLNIQNVSWIVCKLHHIINSPWDCNGGLWVSSVKERFKNILLSLSFGRGLNRRVGNRSLKTDKVYQKTLLPSCC